MFIIMICLWVGRAFVRYFAHNTLEPHKMDFYEIDPLFFPKITVTELA